MKKLIALSLLALPLCGCVNTAKLVDALKDDPATVHFSITTIYGRVDLTRTNPQTNTMPHTITPDGTVTVTDKK